MVLVDTNVLLDVLEDDPKWATWSQEQLDGARLADSLAINPNHLLGIVHCVRPHRRTRGGDRRGRPRRRAHTPGGTVLGRQGLSYLSPRSRHQARRTARLLH